MPHNALDFTNPAARRLGALALFRNEHGEVLMVEKAYKTGPARCGLPGGGANADETAVDACRREVEEETGLRITPGRALVVHHMPASGDAKEGINVVFDCGILPGDTVLVLGDELTSCRWVAPQALHGMVAPYIVRRVTAAVELLNAEMLAPVGAPYLVGHPPAT